MSKSPLVTIKAFSGNAADFFDWQDSLLSSARRMDTDLTDGVLAYLLSREEFKVVRNYYPTFLPELPEQPLVPKAGESVTDFKLSYDMWNDAYKRQRNLDASVDAFLEAFFAALPPEQASAALNGKRKVTITLRDAYANLVRSYATPEKLVEAHGHILAAPYQPQVDMTHFIATHKKSHTVYEEAGQKLPPVEMYKALVAAIKPCGRFGPILERLRMSSELRNFTSLSTLLIEYAGSPDFVETTALGYSNSAAQATPPVDRLDRLERMVETLTTGFQAMAVTKQTSGKTKSSSTTGKSDKSLFCFTHGLGHLGTNCKYPAADHQPLATWAEPMGSKHGRKTP